MHGHIPMQVKALVTFYCLSFYKKAGKVAGPLPMKRQGETRKHGSTYQCLELGVPWRMVQA